MNWNTSLVVVTLSILGAIVAFSGYEYVGGFLTGVSCGIPLANIFLKFWNDRN